MRTVIYIKTEVSGQAGHSIHRHRVLLPIDSGDGGRDHLLFQRGMSMSRLRPTPTPTVYRPGRAAGSRAVEREKWHRLAQRRIGLEEVVESDAVLAEAIHEAPAPALPPQTWGRRRTAPKGGGLEALRITFDEPAAAGRRVDRCTVLADCCWRRRWRPSTTRCWRRLWLAALSARALRVRMSRVAPDVPCWRSPRREVQ